MSREFIALALRGGAVGAVHIRAGGVAERLVWPLSDAQALRANLRRFSGLPVVVHDIASFRAVSGWADSGQGTLWVDTRTLAWAVWPEELDSTLAHLVGRIPYMPSDEAAGWAEATARLLVRLLDDAGSAPPAAQDMIAMLLPDRGWIGAPAAPSPSRARRVAVRSVGEAFAMLTASGTLAHRRAQVAYAEAAAEAFGGGGIYLLEAGPGTGKTIGYLVPLLLALGESDGRAVVATRTRALQEQLWRRDLPLLCEEMGVDLECALLKGRENYLCLRQLEEVRHRLLPREILAPLLAWAAQTDTGDLDGLAGLRSDPVGREVIRGLPDLSYRCGGRACLFWDRCPSRRAREMARAARLVVVNHALLGADLASGGAILGPYDLLVVDEAHALPEALRDALSDALSPAVIPRLLGELRRGQAGLLAAWAGPAAVGRATEAWEQVAAAHRQFWADASAALPRDIGRYGPADVGRLLPAGRLLGQTLEGLAETIGELAPNLSEDAAVQARGLGSEMRRMAGLVECLLRPEREDTVFWYVRDPRGLTLTASPLDVGDRLRAALWPDLVGGVLTSATLSVGDDGCALARDLGLDSPPPFRAWPSPFPYDRVGAFVLRYLPHPDDPAFPEALASTLRRVLADVPRRALALFTSRRLLEATAGHLVGTPHLVQRRDGEREGLLARFRHSPPPVVLLGLDTLWEGIDLPGEQLELLVVARLPFPVPGDPLIQAQAERMANRGENPFQQLFIPRAVLRLRQGVGRLVRTPTDRGAVLLADPRIATRPYGDAFLRTLPVHAQWMDGPDQLIVALNDLFR